LASLSAKVVLITSTFWPFSSSPFVSTALAFDPVVIACVWETTNMVVQLAKSVQSRAKKLTYNLTMCAAK